MCRKYFTVPVGGGAGLPKNIFVTQMSELKKLSNIIAEEMACDACEKEASAVRLCTTCVQKLCKECCESHKRIRTTRNHRLLSLRRSTDESVEVAKLLRSYCKDHDERILEMYCSDCGEIICLLCHAMNHCGHRCVLVDNVAEERRQQMGQDIQALTATIQLENNLLVETATKRQQLETSLAKAKTDIARHAKALKSVIDRQARDLTAEAERLAENEKKEIDRERATIENSVALKQGFYKYMRQMYENGTSVDLVRDAKQLHARAVEIQPAIRMENVQASVTFRAVKWEDMVKERKSQFIGACEPRSGTIGTANLSRIYCSSPQVSFRNAKTTRSTENVFQRM